MKINKQSNVYIVVYIIILVTIVGAGLAFTSQRLRPLQQANIDADKMKQILASVHIVPDKGDVKSEFEKYVVNSFVVDSEGRRDNSVDAFSVDVAAQSKLPADERLLPVYVVKLADEHAEKYVLPVYGAGLWGPIWGYVAVDGDGSTIYGAFFSHQGETPGLGAEIAKPAFADQFIDKSLFKEGNFVPVEVVKNGQHPAGNADYVDGISGGTITSKGVGAMLDNCLRPYRPFLASMNKKSD